MNLDPIKGTNFFYDENIKYVLWNREAVDARSLEVQGQTGWGFEQPGPLKRVPAHGRGVGLYDL